jgi:hypothetical protein
VIDADELRGLAERVQQGGDLRPAQRPRPVVVLPPHERTAERPLRRIVIEWHARTQLLRQGDAKVFKKYSQMKLQMKREALHQKLD